MDEMIVFFLEEASELLDRLRSLLSESVKGLLSDDEREELSRVLHNIKGSSASVGLRHYSKFVHRIEDLISPFKNANSPLRLKKDYVLLITDRLEDCGRRLQSGASEEAFLQEALEWLEATFNSEAAGEVSNKPESARPETLVDHSPERSVKEESFLRVPERILDNIFQLVEEMAQIKNSYQYHHRSKTVALESLMDIDDRFDIILKRMNHNVLASRLVKFEKVAQRMQRVVDQYLKQSQKKVRFVMTHVEMEVDKAVVDGIPDLLIHLVKNGLDHGIEPPGDRVAAGKPEEAVLELRCAKDGDNFQIDVIDDGRGIDPKRVGASAVKKGIISQEQLDSMGEGEIRELIFKPGFSTAEKVTDISGRGVGMDAVLAGVSRLGGKVELFSEVGRGTRTSLIFPSSLKFVEVFVAQCGGHCVLLPLKQVDSVRHLRESERREISAGRVFLTIEGTLVETIDLRTWLGYTQERAATVLILFNIEGRRMGLLTEKVEGKANCVVKPLHTSFGGFPWYQGGVILGNGEISILLDLYAIVREYIKGKRMEVTHVA